MNSQQDAARTRLSTLVREYRQAAGLTQRQLAERSGLSVATVRDLEQGRRHRPWSGSLTALVGALGLDRRQTSALAIAGDAGRPAPVGRGDGLWLAALGPLAAWRDGLPLGLGPPKRREVLGLLALQPGELVRRETVIAALWGQRPPTTAAAVMQAHVSKLRLILDPGSRDGLLEQGKAGYRLRAGAGQSDVAAFTELAARAATAAAAGDAAAACGLYQEALGLWRGDPAGDAEGLRGHQAVTDLLRRRADAVLGYAKAASGLGWHERVIPLLDALAREQPLNERAHARLMVALAGAGQQAAAIKAFEDVRRRLDEELGVYPGHELAEAHQRVLRQDIPSAANENAAAANGPAGMRGAGRTAPSTALVGRDKEMALLTGLIRQVAGGQGGSVLLEGEPGIGKSALVQAAVERAAEAGCQVFWGAGDELGQALPLLPLLDGLRVREPSANPRRSAIVGLLRGEGSVGRGTDVAAVLTEQLLALAAEECAARPTILVVDDLQWADQASVTLWGRLARLARQVPLLLIGMMRPVPQRDDLLALRRAAGDAARLRLTALTGGAVTDLVAALAGGRPGGDLLRLADGAAGNPLYLTELVAALARGSGLTITGAGTVELASDSAPGSMSAAIADRLDFVAGPVREVLRAAALLGTDFAVSDLAILLDRGLADLIPAIDEARAAGVLAESGNGLGFRHPLIRAALYDEIPAPVRAAWHRDAGRVLAAADAPAHRVARQLLWSASGPGGTTEQAEEWMLDWLARTADQLVGQAPGVAAELLARALASSPAGSARHGRLSSRLADSLYRIGDRAQAEQVAVRALAHTDDPDLLVDLHWTLAQCRILAGKFAESLATLDRALASPGLSARHRARLLVLTARTNTALGDVDTGSRVATSALAMAEEAGDNWAMGWALHVLTIVTTMRGHEADALPLFDQALAVTESDPALADLRLLLQINQVATLGNLDEYERAFDVARQARDLAGQVGTTIRLAQAHDVLGQLFFETGRWDDALAELEIMPEYLMEPSAACDELAIAAVIRFHRGEIAAARRHLAAAAPHVERIGHRLIGPLALARSLDREHADALPEALAELTAAFGDSAGHAEGSEDLLADAVRLAVRTGDLGIARVLTGRAAELAGGSDIPHRLANAIYCRGLLDHDATRLLAAADRYQDIGRPLPTAMALEAAAVEFIRVGDRGQARGAFIRAVEAYTSLGASYDVARIRATLRAHGIRPGPPPRGKRAITSRGETGPRTAPSGETMPW